MHLKHFKSTLLQQNIYIKEKKYNGEGTSLVVQWLKFQTSNAEDPVQSLVVELRPHMLYGQKINKKIKRKNKGETKTFSDKRKLREFIANRETLNEMIKFHIFR